VTGLGRAFRRTYQSHNVANLVPSVPAVEHSTVAARHSFWRVPPEYSCIPKTAAFAVAAFAFEPGPIVAVAAEELAVEAVVAAELGRLLKLAKLVLLLVAGEQARRWMKRQCWV
jgi:hypothetical protein